MRTIWVDTLIMYITIKGNFSKTGHKLDDFSVITNKSLLCCKNVDYNSVRTPLLVPLPGTTLGGVNQHKPVIKNKSEHLIVNQQVQPTV